jgi:hypothetical protein
LRPRKPKARGAIFFKRAIRKLAAHVLSHIVAMISGLRFKLQGPAQAQHQMT